jgi:hypothetical protein
MGLPVAFSTGVIQVVLQKHLSANNSLTERVILAVTLWTCIRKVLSVRISTGTQAILIKVLHDFPQFFQRNARIVTRLVQNLIHQNPLQFILRQSCHEIAQHS